MAGLFAGLVGGVFLRALVLEHVAEQAERFSAPCSPCRIEEKFHSCIAVDEADPLLRVGQRLGDVGQAGGSDCVSSGIIASFSMSKGSSKSM